jgi:hypothetical protein
MSVNSFDYIQIINHLCPDSFFSIDDDDYSTLIWSPNNTHSKPSENEIIAKNTELIHSVAYEHLRYERNILLSECDKYSLPDFPHANDTIRDQWLAYRQALRDITSQIPVVNLATGEVSGVTWPTLPE